MIVAMALLTGLLVFLVLSVAMAILVQRIEDRLDRHGRKLEEVADTEQVIRMVDTSGKRMGTGDTIL